MSSLVSLTQLRTSPARAQNGSAESASHPRPERLSSPPRRLIDSHGREIHDLRLSITDRCNFRCVYCMDPGVKFADPRVLLTVDEMSRVARACINLGVRNIRLTGGEPTIHPRLTEIIAAMAALGIEDLAMTTNGSLCTRDNLHAWKAAGLHRLTFSLDAVSSGMFASMTRSEARTAGVGDVINAIRLAIEEGFAPVKVNAVVIRGRNEAEIPLLAKLAREVGFEMRFIEYMPLDSGHHWDQSLLVPASEIIQRAGEAGELKPQGRDEPNSTSETYVFTDAPEACRIGIIAPVTRPFCGQCSRLRITADAKIRPCLFSLQETDLMSTLRAPLSAPDQQVALEETLLAAVWSKQAGHGITSPTFQQPDRPMSAIGG